MVDSVNQDKPDHYIFVIDTDSYSGNFEREMCAYITGQIGECGKGDKQASFAGTEIPELVTKFEEIIEQVADEHGCYRPTSIFQSPKYGNDGDGKHVVLTDENKEQFPWPAYNSVAIYFNERPDANLIEVMKERATTFSEFAPQLCNEYLHHMTIEGFRLLEQRTTITELNISE
jgi:hypothetical protein